MTIFNFLAILFFIIFHTRGVCLQGRGGLHPGGFASREVGGSASRGVGGLHPGEKGGLHPPPELGKQAIHIPLECFLV